MRSPRRSLPCLALLGTLLIVGLFYFSSRLRKKGDLPPICFKDPTVKISHVQSLWYTLNDATRLWSTVHYEPREFSYGVPALILMLFHDRQSCLPDLYMKVNDQCLSVSKWIPFGKMAKIDERDYLFYAVYLLNNTLPDSVAVTYSDCTTPLTPNLPVYRVQGEREFTFATCLHQPLELKDDKLLDMVSWLEIQHVIGVEHITIYNQNIAPLILKTLQSYQRKGFVDIIDWKLDNTENRIGVNGQLGLINDCLYRYLGKAQYILFIDVDEVIIPHSNKTLREMIDHINSRESHITKYGFYNSYWHNMGELVPGADKYKNPDIIPVHFKRTHRTKDCPSTRQIKNIYRAKTTVRLAVHDVYKMKKGERKYKVPVSVGLMHHYRSPDFAFNEEKVRDDVMSRYLEQVMARVCDQLSLSC